MTENINPIDYDQLKQYDWIMALDNSIATVIVVILIFGIPILINGCYKHGGYITI